jgi:DNA polymerase-3 subunit beta
MKITIKRDTFLGSLEITKDSVGKQTALPVLRNIKLTVKDGFLKLFTTNLSIGTVASLKDLSIFSEGEVLCDASKLITIVKELPEKEIRMETDEKGHLLMECEKSHFRLFTMPPEEFPAEPEIPEDKLVSIDRQFFEFLGRARYAASKDNNRYNLNCIYLDKEVVATDGHRMSVIKKNLGFDNILIPLDFVNIILKARNRKDGNTFQVGCSNNIFFLKSEDLVIFGRLIDGEFPDYAQVIPNDSSRYALIERKGLIQAIKRIMLMSGKNYQMRFEFSPLSLNLSSITPDLGDASEEIEAEYKSEQTDHHGSFAIGFNGKYLLDMLETLEGERVTISMENEVSPAKVDEEDSIHILMPLRLVELGSKPGTETETASENELEGEQQAEPESVEVQELD